MAKNDKSLDKALSNAIDDILKDWKGAMTNAVEFAVKQAESDWMNKAKSCLEEYYEHKPKEYDRINILQYAFLPYKNIKYGKDKITGSVGVQYDPTSLETHIGDPVTDKGDDGIERIKHVGYYGSAKHQPVDAWWVIENYLMGLHPDGGDSRSTFYADDLSPNAKMGQYKKDYEKIFDENVLLGLLGQIAKKIK